MAIIGPCASPLCRTTRTYMRGFSQAQCKLSLVAALLLVSGGGLKHSSCRLGLYGIIFELSIPFRCAVGRPHRRPHSSRSIPVRRLHCCSSFATHLQGDINSLRPFDAPSHAHDAPPSSYLTLTARVLLSRAAPTHQLSSTYALNHSSRPQPPRTRWYPTQTLRIGARPEDRLPLCRIPRQGRLQAEDIVVIDHTLEGRHINHRMSSRSSQIRVTSR